MKRCMFGLCALVVIVVPVVALGAPPTIDLAIPDVVDWAQVATVILAFLGLATVTVAGVVLSMRVARKLIGRLGRSA